jgi:hypothetical protein
MAAKTREMMAVLLRSCLSPQAGGHQLAVDGTLQPGGVKSPHVARYFLRSRKVLAGRETVAAIGLDGFGAREKEFEELAE